MGQGIRLKEIKVKGFRGYGDEERRLDLAHPVVVLYGGNRSGKSSTLNAVEWALFGGEVVGKKIGIEERKGWLACNRRCGSAVVELVLETGSGEILVHRELGGGRKRSGGIFYFKDEKGRQHEDEVALWALLGMNARDFMSSAYLHQEVIRDIVVSTPSVRKEALDRLLGISEVRELLNSLKDVKSKGYRDEAGKVYRDLNDFIATRSSAYREAIDEAHEEGSRRGLERKDLTPEGLARICAEVAASVERLARDAGLEGPGLEAPGGPEDFPAFREEAQRALRRLRSENPAARSRERLYEERESLDEALSRLRSKKKALKALQEERKELEKDGDLEALRARRDQLESERRDLQSRLERLNARMPVVEATISYLERLEDREARTPCPSCEQEVVPSELLQRLAEVRSEAGAEVEELGARYRELERGIHQVERREKELSALLETRLPRAEEEVRACTEEISGLLGREISAGEDPEVLASRRLEEIDGELEKLKGELQRYNEGIGSAEDLLDVAGLIHRALEAEAKIRAIDSITGSPAWAELNRTRDELNRELENLEALRKAVEEVLKEMAGEKLEEAKSAVSDFYRSLVQRPDFEGIVIDPRDFEVYAVSDGDREKVVTFFNQGDMNCAAISIFLALGSRGGGEGGVAFLMLDDPSQSLDSRQKERLAELIDRVACDRQVVVSTMDEELFRALKSRVAREKKVYLFGEWDPVKGPSIGEE